MRRFLPSSLLGQVMLVLAVGLLVAQTISAVLLYRAAEQRREAAVVSSVAFRLIAESARPEISTDERMQRRLRRLQREGIGPEARAQGQPFPRRMRLGIERSRNSPVEAGENRLGNFEQTLSDVLSQQDLAVGDVLVTRRVAGEDPYVRQTIEGRRRPPPPNWQERTILVASVQRADRTGWLTARIPEPRRTEGGPTPLIVQTVLIYAVLVLLLYLVLRQITRPLARLTERVSDFSKSPDTVVMLEESGPSDTRRLIAAHNAMEARIAALLDEKDVMLGAIGHDLKTPLAALRVRIESVPDDVQRERMASSIEDITRTLDDILSLARVGRGNETSEAVDLGALASGIVEEFEDLGEPVTIADPPSDRPRIAAKVQETWLKRALRNLVSNAVRYGQSAEVTVLQEADMAILRVDDSGPGIPTDQIASMLEPFTRGEASRNRATGGAGLGLTLARAIAEAHDGSLSLSNRADGGLRAEIRVPLG